MKTLLFRLLLLLQPRAVRERYGDELLDVARRGNVLRESLDLLVAGRAAIGRALIAAAVVHIGYALSVYPEDLMGGSAILLTAAAFFGGWALVRPRRGTYV